MLSSPLLNPPTSRRSQLCSNNNPRHSKTCMDGACPNNLSSSNNSHKVGAMDKSKHKSVGNSPLLVAVLKTMLTILWLRCTKLSKI